MRGSKAPTRACDRHSGSEEAPVGVTTMCVPDTPTASMYRSAVKRLNHEYAASRAAPSTPPWWATARSIRLRSSASVKGSSSSRWIAPVAWPIRRARDFVANDSSALILMSISFLSVG